MALFFTISEIQYINFKTLADLISGLFVSYHKNYTALLSCL